MDLKQASLQLHKKSRGKLATQVTTPINSKEDLSLVYTPGVAEVSKEIYENPETVYDLTIKGHTVAVITDGSAVLGLGNIGPDAALPVMEGKAALFKTLADIDAFPLCINSQDSGKIIETVRQIAPVFGGINLEDISAPRCFEIEDALQDLGIPVMHDDQHGTAVAVLAGLINSAKVVEKNMKDLKVVISGAGAAGNAVSRLIYEVVKDVILVDSKGIITKSRTDLDEYKHKLAQFTNLQNISGSLQDALVGADVFIGVSKAELLTAEDIKKMNSKAIVFAMANPVPEIMPDEAKKGGAYVVATGRSDFPNQINNALVFPGIFKGALEVRAEKITKKMKIAAAEALAGMVSDPTADFIVPSPLEKKVVEAISEAVIRSWKI